MSAVFREKGHHYEPPQVGGWHETVRPFAVACREALVLGIVEPIELARSWEVED